MIDPFDPQRMEIFRREEAPFAESANELALCPAQIVVNHQGFNFEKAVRDDVLRENIRTVCGLFGVGAWFITKDDRLVHGHAGDYSIKGVYQLNLSVGDNIEVLSARYTHSVLVKRRPFFPQFSVYIEDKGNELTLKDVIAPSRDLLKYF